MRRARSQCSRKWCFSAPAHEQESITCNQTTNKARHRQLDESGVLIARGPSQRRPPCPLTSGFRHARRRGVRRQAGPRRTRPVCSSRPLRRCGDGSAGGGAYSLAGEHGCESEELGLVERGGLALYSGLLKIDGNSSHWSCGENYPLRFAEIEQEYGMIGPCGLGPDPAAGGSGRHAETKNSALLLFWVHVAALLEILEKPHNDSHNPRRRPADATFPRTQACPL